MAEPPAQRPNLYLVGFMGTGKSTVGRALARKLKLEFLDSDREIEKAEDRAIAEIFATEGEPYFRDLERAFVEKGHPATGCVVACGGGLVVQPGMAEALRARGIVASLFATPETIVKRTSQNKNRPLLNVADPQARVAELLAQREPHYLKAGACFMTDLRPLSEVVEHLANFYERRARELQAASAQA